jgi:CRP-like cAMP-binding protein
MGTSAPANPKSPKISLSEKLARFVDLTAQERAHLNDIQPDVVSVRGGCDIVRAGQTYRCIYILNEGMAIRYKVLHDGRRHVLNLILPGDFVGFPGCMFEKSLYSISGLNDIAASVLSFDAVFDLFKRYPRLGAAMFWMAGHEAALFAEHLVGIGRQSAYERVAHLLLELLVRMQMVELADDQSYELPLTQELIADTLGLSVPHVNRTLRRLREDGLISFEGPRLTCLDVSALSKIADFDGVNFSRQRAPWPPTIPGADPARSR